MEYKWLIEHLYCRSVVSENSRKCTLTESSRSLQAANETSVSRIRACNAQAIRHSANVRLYQDDHRDEALELRPKNCILCLFGWKLHTVCTWGVLRDNRSAMLIYLLFETNLQTLAVIISRSSLNPG